VGSTLVQLLATHAGSVEQGADALRMAALEFRMGIDKTG